MAAGEVDTGDLQVATIDVTLLKRDIVAYGDHLRGAAAHVVVLAMHGGDGAVYLLADEVRGGAIFGIVADVREVLNKQAQLYKDMGVEPPVDILS